MRFQKVERKPFSAFEKRINNESSQGSFNYSATSGSTIIKAFDNSEVIKLFQSNTRPSTVLMIDHIDFQHNCVMLYVDNKLTNEHVEKIKQAIELIGENKTDKKLSLSTMEFIKSKRLVQNVSPIGFVSIS